MDGRDGPDQRGLVRMREQQDRLFRMVHLVSGQAGVILCEVNDCVLAGYIGRADYDKFTPVHGGVEVDGADASACDAGTYGGTVPHAGQSQVVDILRSAQHLGAALLAQRGTTYVAGADMFLREGIRVRLDVRCCQCCALFPPRFTPRYRKRIAEITARGYIA